MSDKVTQAHDDFEMRALLARERLNKWDFTNWSESYQHKQLATILKDVIKSGERFVHLRDETQR